MRRVSIVVAMLVPLVAAGCSSAERKGAAPLVDRAEKSQDQTSGDKSPHEQGSEKGGAEKAPGERLKDDGDNKWKADAAHGRAPEGTEQTAAAETERTVALPDTVELAAAPATPDRPRVAVAFVRGGKLVRRGDALRRLQHDLEKDARVEALERFEDGAPSPLGLDQLCERATKQGAHLLLVDARPTDDGSERTTYVLAAKAPWKALAFTRARAAEPAGQELIARLVRTSRTGP